MAQSSYRRSREIGGTINVSFELFPPKTPQMEEQLWDCVDRLSPLLPEFISVTYGAGGSTRERTHRTVEKLIKDKAIAAAAHLTCVGATRAEVDAVVKDYLKVGVKHIVALRGDPPEGIGSDFTPYIDGYNNSTQLIEGLRKIGDFEIIVSAYPEKHPTSPSIDFDLEVLKAKVDAGANRAITQFFFDNSHYLRYLDKARAKNIEISIIPGIVPVQNFRQMAAFAARAGASVPNWFAKRFEGLDHDPITRKLIAAAIAAEQVLDLVDHGITNFHFYTMNRADLVFAICHLLGLRVQSHPALEKAPL